MSIQEVSIIDFVSFDKKKNEVELTISDHLDWSDVGKHFLLLQEKINNYCKYIENGQIYSEYPETRDASPIIVIVFFHVPTNEACKFLEKIKAILESEGFNFKLVIFGKTVDKS